MAVMLSRVWYRRGNDQSWYHSERAPSFFVGNGSDGFRSGLFASRMMISLSLEDQEWNDLSCGIEYLSPLVGHAIRPEHTGRDWAHLRYFKESQLSG